MHQTSSRATNGNCSVCGVPLVYDVKPTPSVCGFCGTQQSTLIRCPAGHFVCDACHAKPALEVLADVLRTATSTNPIALLEQVMAHPSVAMHGPEHHAIVPTVIVAAVRNAGYPVPSRALVEALERGRMIPGGWCGSHGAGATAIGVGIAVSVLIGATPLTGRERSTSMAATSFALSRMLDDQPRCCKRASRSAVESAVAYLDERLGISLPTTRPSACAYTARNAECSGGACPYI